LIVAALSLSLSACRQQQVEVVGTTLAGETMGTTYTIRLVKIPEGQTGATLKQAVDAALERVNDAMSTYRPDSELSRFNESDSTDWFPVSKETAAVVAEAQRVSHESHGAFDVTVLPLVNLWSFGPEARPDAVPSDVQLAQRRKHVGYEKLEVRLDPPALRKSDSHMSVDLSAIAKGYGVDVVAELLDERGVKAYMVEIGGEVRTKGPKPDGDAWHIGIERPVAKQRAVETVVDLGSDAMATSGDYRNYFEAGGKRYSHTIDPRTGRPIEHTLVSASVFSSTCMTADAYATTAMVLGPAEGYDWLVEHEAPALLIVKVGDRFVEKPTPAFEERKARMERELAQSEE
jgi:thiamine biosynthesis lipoprotein